jgi:RNA polymerase subunit RPABC4/transcription elongation factor Spt4
MPTCPRCKLPQKSFRECEYCGFDLTGVKIKCDLVDCSACGAQVSKNAKSCPNCGEPRTTEEQKIFLTVILIMTVISSVVFSFCQGSFRNTPTTNQPYTRSSTEDKIRELSDRTGTSMNEIRRNINFAKGQGRTEEEAFRITEEAIKLKDAEDYSFKLKKK